MLDGQAYTTKSRPANGGDERFHMVTAVSLEEVLATKKSEKFQLIWTGIFGKGLLSLKNFTVIMFTTTGTGFGPLVMVI